MNNESVEEITEEIKILTIKNRGTGAGGSKTNKNGISYEKLTDLNTRLNVIKKLEFGCIITFDNKERCFIKTQQSNFFKFMKDKTNTQITRGHGCKNPDECYVDEELKIIFIIEKKFQQCSGSVCEKIQTPEFKIWNYQRTFPGYKIVYVYCLSDWFKENCIAELEYLDFINIRYFWGNSESYKDDIIKFIINYK